MSHQVIFTLNTLPLVGRRSNHFKCLARKWGQWHMRHGKRKTFRRIRPIAWAGSDVAAAVFFPDYFDGVPCLFHSSACRKYLLKSLTLKAEKWCYQTFSDGMRVWLDCFIVPFIWLLIFSSPSPSLSLYNDGLSLLSRAMIRRYVF